VPKRGKAWSIWDFATAEQRVEMNEGKTVVRALVGQREAKAGGQCGLTHAPEKRILQVQETVARAFGETVPAVATALQLEQIS
jgi:hypothetical protein